MFGRQAKLTQLGEGEIAFDGLISKTTLSDIPLGVVCKVSFFNETITLKVGGRSFSILKSQVFAAGTFGARTNAAGIVITGITGADSKQRTTQHFYSYINFKSASGEIHQVDFEVYPPIKQVDLFNKEISPCTVVTTAL